MHWRGLLTTLAILAILALTGCGGERTYTVRFLNNSQLATDFRIDERGRRDDTLVLRVAGNGGRATVIHDGLSSPITIQSGVAVGEDLSIIDASCTFAVTDNDTVDIVKTAEGTLEFNVIPDPVDARVGSRAADTGAHSLISR